MDINPQQIRTAEFRTVRKGLDPDEVRSFLTSVADEFQRAQNEATAMEARARAAVARVQELESAEPREPEPQPTIAPSAEPSTEQADAISRTLLLAQRTADTTIAEAEREATRLRGAAETESAKTLDSTREMAAKLIEEAREEARRESEDARSTAAGEVDALLARRDFLESDVTHLERFLTDQRSRLREAANELLSLTDRVPSGLGEVRPPLLSAADEPAESADEPAVTTDQPADEPPVADDRSAGQTVVVADADATPPGDAPSAGDPTQALDPPADRAVGSTPRSSESERPAAIPDHTPVFGLGDSAARPASDESAEDDEFRFSFDDEQR